MNFTELYIVNALFVLERLEFESSFVPQITTLETIEVANDRFE